MFRLEKVFQNDDSGYIFFVNFIKSLSIVILIYIFSILKNNSIFELKNYELFFNSNFFNFSIILSINFFINSFFKKPF